MNVVLWALAGLLALVFLGAGAMKALRPKEKVIEATGPWAEDFPPALLKVIGVAEILGAIGLILPAALNIAPVLVPIAAVALAVTMVGAAFIHGRRGETQGVVTTVLLLILAALLAWGRFGPCAF